VESINDDILAVDAVTLLIQHQTCNSQVTGSSPGRMRLHSVLGQAIYTCVCHQAV